MPGKREFLLADFFQNKASAFPTFEFKLKHQVSCISTWLIHPVVLGFVNLHNHMSQFLFYKKKKKNPIDSASVENPDS